MGIGGGSGGRSDELAEQPTVRTARVVSRIEEIAVVMALCFSMAGIFLDSTD
jgi:hypothetical protein